MRACARGDARGQPCTWSGAYLAGQCLLSPTACVVWKLTNSHVSFGVIMREGFFGAQLTLSELVYV
jgi:hypothetical protein